MNVLLVGEVRTARRMEFSDQKTGELIQMIKVTVETSVLDETGNEILGMHDFNFRTDETSLQLLSAKGKYISVPMVYKASGANYPSSLKQVWGVPFVLYDKNPFEGASVDFASGKTDKPAKAQS